MAKLYFNYGAMNAGKSTILLQAAHNYHERGMRTALLKPVIDTRDETEEKIASRIGLARPAHGFATHSDLYEYVNDLHKVTTLDCVLVDEAQFLSEAQVWQLVRLADEIGIPVMCYGIRTDFQGRLFEGSAALLALADNVREIKTLCWCGRKATMNMRIDGEGRPVTEGTQIEIGGNERYISLCRRHWTTRQAARTGASSI